MGSTSSLYSYLFIPTVLILVAAHFSHACHLWFVWREAPCFNQLARFGHQPYTTFLTILKATVIPMSCLLEAVLAPKPVLLSHLSPSTCLFVYRATFVPYEPPLPSTCIFSFQVTTCTATRPFSPPLPPLPPFDNQLRFEATTSTTSHYASPLAPHQPAV